MVIIINDNIIKFVETKLKDCEDVLETQFLEEILLVFKTSRTPEKTLKKKISEVEDEIISIKQSSMLVKQINKHIEDNEENIEEDTENYKKFYSSKIDEFYKEILKLTQKIDFYIFGIALFKLDNDTNGEYIKIELGEENDEN